MSQETLQLIALVLGEGLIGYVLWLIGNKAEKTKLKADAIRDLMAYRGDYSSADFRRALNKVSLIFHDNSEIRTEVRQLYETMNDQRNNTERIKRKIVGLIFKLCQQNGFDGLSEYDIDQSFSESKQTPISDDSPPPSSTPPPPIPKPSSAPLEN